MPIYGVIGKAELYQVPSPDITFISVVIFQF